MLVRIGRVLPLVFAAFLACTAPGAAEADTDFLRDLDAALALPILREAETVAPVSTAVPDSNVSANDTGAAPASPATPVFDSLFHDIRVRVTSRRHTILSSQSTGRIEALTARDGDRFAEGDVLVRIDDATLQIQRTRAVAALGRQQVLYRVAREMADLQSRGEAEVEVARMEMEQADAELRVIDLLLARTRVIAPFPGRIADVFVKEKQYVPEGTPLLEILDDSTLELEFIVPSVWMRWFTPGYRFSVVVEETGATFNAVLERLGGKVDPLSQSVKAYAQLVDPGSNLMEGMSGSARIVPPEPPS